MLPRKWPLVENNDCLGKIVQVFFHRSSKRSFFVWKFGYTNYGIIYCSISLLYGAGLMMRNSAKPEYQAVYLCECKKLFRSLGHPTRAV